MRRSIIFLSLVTLLSCGDSNETRIQRFLILGNEKIVEREYEQAERYFKSALKLDSCFVDALNNLGTVEHRRQDLPASAKYYSKALECKPQFHLAYLNRANVYYEMGLHAEAFEDIARAEKYVPDTSAIFQLKGLLYWKTHQPARAIENFKILLSRDQEDTDMLINIGTLFTEIRNLDSARFYLTKALSLKPNEAQAFNAMAILEVESGNLNDADVWIDKALAINPSDAYFQNNKGYILILKKDLDAALGYINRSIAADPYNGWAYRNKGIYSYHAGNFSESTRLLRRAEEIDPLIDDLYLWLGLALTGSGDKKQGCLYFQKAVAHSQVKAVDLPDECRL